MPTLTSLLPDVDVLLDLTQEELAEVVLQLAKEHRQNGIINLLSFTSEYQSPIGTYGGYPAHRLGEADLAIAEAWNWLTVQGLLVPTSGLNGINGHKVLSRRAEKMLDTGEFKSFARSVSFSKALLHPKIADEVWIDLARGDFVTAVFRSYKAVEIEVRAAGRFVDTDVGTVLMRKAFDKKTGPLANLDQPEAEREALAHLFTGAIGSYKNPHSHRTVTVGSQAEAQEMVILASHLLRIVDSRRPQ